MMCRRKNDRQGNLLWCSKKKLHAKEHKYVSFPSLGRSNTQVNQIRQKEIKLQLNYERHVSFESDLEITFTF